MNRTYFRYRGLILSTLALPILHLTMHSEAHYNLNALFILAAATLIRLGASLYIHNQTGKTEYRSTELAIDGFYSLSRNPLYISNVLAVTGIIAFMNLPSVFINLGTVLLVIIHHETVIRGEEQF